MTRIEDEFKDRYADQELPSDHFDKEGLWGAITADLDRGAQSGTTSSQMWLWLLFFLLGLGVGVATVYYFNMQDSGIAHQQYAESDDISKNDKTIPDLRLSVPASDMGIVVDSGSGMPQALSSAAMTRAVPDTTLLLSKKDALSRAVASPDQDQGSPAMMDLRRASALVEAIGALATTADLLIDEPEGLHLVSKSDSDRRMALSVAGVSALSLAPIVSDASFEIDLALLSGTLPSEQWRKDRYWELNAWGGVNTVDFRYRSQNAAELAEQKEQSESRVASHSVGLNGVLLLRNRYLLSVGLEYHQLWSKLDWTNAQPTKVFKENQLLQVFIDGSTGDTLSGSYGDIFVDAIATRSVVHYNRFRRISIPFEFGMQQTTQKLVYGLSAGGVLSLTLSQSGKALDSDSAIIDFDDASSARSFSQVAIGVRVNPFVGYRLSDKWTVRLQPQWTWTPGSDFGTTDIRIHSHQFNLNVGVAYAIR